MTTCYICNSPTVDLETRHRKDLFLKTGRAYCPGQDCTKIYRQRCSSETMSKTNRKYASKRMTEKNPMRLEETRLKVSTSLKAIGHKPAIQGGNGKPATIAEQSLNILLDGLNFVPQYIQPTRQKIYNGETLPTHFKIDLANPKLKIAIEIDGNSHNALVRRAQDKKKESFLTGLGWKVLRFKNAEVLDSPEATLFTILKLMGYTPTP